MNRRIAFFLTLALVLSLLAGCAGTPVVYYTNCTCPAGSHDASGGSSQPDNGPVDLPQGAVKTGLAIVTGVGKSESGVKADYDVTLVAVNVDDSGIITACVIDSIGATVNFDATGTITSDLTAPIATKNELGDSYNMVLYGNARAEWYQQAGALADFAVGKTLAELKSGAVSQSGYAPEGTDLAASASIYLGGYVAAIEVAVNNARHLGAESGDELKLVATASVGNSVSAGGSDPGLAQLDCDAAAVNIRQGVITACAIDSVQAKVSFDATGAITTDLTAPVQTKNQLGSAYNMVAYGNAIAEWDQQAASFAAYVTGKTADQVAGIAVTQGKPAEADLAASVTIAITGFQALIAKAFA